MKRKSFLKLRYFFIVVLVCLNWRVCFSVSLDGILNNNKYIELENQNQQLVKLKIKRDGLYAVRSSGTNGVVMELLNKANEKIHPNFIECDGNIFATYNLKAKGAYYVSIKMRIEDTSEKSKLWLYFLDDSVLMDEKGIEANINSLDEDRYFKYVPKCRDVYMINSTGGMDLRASLYDDLGVKIQDSSNITGLNFKMLEELDKGKCYYVRVSSNNDVGNFKVEVLKKRFKNKNTIDLYMDDSLDNDFFGYVKKGSNEIKFISNVDGEYKFVLMSEMNLGIDIENEERENIVKDCEWNKNYSFVLADIEKGKEYIIKISNNLDKIGVYKLRILNFGKLRRYSKDIIVGKNKGIISREDRYLRFVCPNDGVFSFEDIGENYISIDFYDENGKLLKEAKQNFGVFKDIFGIKANKGDVLYLKVSDMCCDLLEFEYDIRVSNFYDLIKDCHDVNVGETSGYIEEVDQVYVYKFEPIKGGMYFIKSNCNKCLSCRLYNDKGSLIGEETRNLDFIVAKNLEKGRAYYIEIGSLRVCDIGEFSFNIVLLDNIKKIEISEDVEISNEIEHLGEVKQYEFCASEDAIYLPKLESKVNLDIVKRDEKGNVIENMSLKKGEKRIIEVFGKDKGSYCLKVENFTKKLRNATNVVCDKEYQGNIIMPKAEDSYSFIPEVGGYYSICAISDVNTRIRVYKITGDIIAENNKEDDVNFCVVVKLEEGEKYLITVNEGTGKETCIYVFAIKQNRESEEGARWIKLHNTKFDIIGYDGDEKIYKIIIPKKGKYFVNNYLDFGLDIEVKDENGNIIEELTKKDIPNRNLYEFDQNCLYYIKLRAKDGISTGMYGLRIENLDKVYKSAKLLENDSFFNVKRTKFGESRYYKCFVKRKGIYNILKVRGDVLYIDVLDEEGNIILSDYLECSRRLNLDVGTCYLRCRSNTGDSGVDIF